MSSENVLSSMTVKPGYLLGSAFEELFGPSYVIEHRVHPPPCLWEEVRLEGCLDVLGDNRHSVVPHRVLAKVEGPFAAIGGDVPPLGQVRDPPSRSSGPAAPGVGTCTP